MGEKEVTRRQENAIGRNQKCQNVVAQRIAKTANSVRTRVLLAQQFADITAAQQNK